MTKLTNQILEKMTDEELIHTINKYQKTEDTFITYLIISEAKKRKNSTNRELIKFQNMITGQT
jgi:predicted nucleic-acid-binding protein